ncbi:hypothetical protein [Pararhodobacter sp.]|uniref:hypothetical protein n=1 Tax=Pararhodobacter sp. TaxID=2127056 RepID=UPI002FDFA69D
MALSLTGAAGLGPASLAWAGWGATGLTGLGLIAARAARSRPERRLWAPVMALMRASALAIVPAPA